MKKGRGDYTGKSKKILAVKAVMTMAFCGVFNVRTLKLHKKNAVSGRTEGKHS